MPALDVLKPMPHANMLVARTKGRVTAYAAGVNEGHGHGQFPEKYAKFAYDTRFGFCASRSREVIYQAAPDSMLAFVIDDNVLCPQGIPLPRDPGRPGGQQVVPLPRHHRDHHRPAHRGRPHPPPRDRKRLPLRGPTTAALPCRTSPPATWSHRRRRGHRPQRRRLLHRVGQRRGHRHQMRPQRQPVQHQRLYPCCPVRHPEGRTVLETEIKAQA